MTTYHHTSEADGGHIVHDHTGRQWRIVATDPHKVTYFDDDAEAIDETNWDALIDDLSVQADRFGEVNLCESGPYWTGDYWFEVATIIDTDSESVDERDTDDLFGTFDALHLNYPRYQGGWPFVDSPPRECRDEYVLLVRVGTSADEEWLNIARALSDYPLLDEDAYSQRDYEAWLEALDDWIPHDVRRELIHDYDEDPDDDERIDMLLDLIPEACQHLHYYSGLTGEYGPSLAGLVIDVDRYHAFCEEWKIPTLPGVRPGHDPDASPPSFYDWQQLTEGVTR